MSRPRDATDRLRTVLGSSTSTELVDYLDDSSPEVVRAALARLVEVDRDRAAALVRARLLDADPALVADFAIALRRIGDESARAVALAGLTDERYTRRLAAATALGVLRDPCSVDELRSCERWCTF